MRYQIDHDYHIHTRLSTCSRDENQTVEALLDYAKKNGMKKLCVTDHFWDETIPCEFRNNAWYERQNFAHVCQNKPLPKDDEVELVFGCETDLDNNDTIGISPARYDEFSFIVVPINHMHMVAGPKWEDRSPAALAKHWVQRFDKVLESDLPFRKVGFAHLVCNLIHKGDRAVVIEALESISREELVRLFTKVAVLGAGVEINGDDMRCAEGKDASVLRIFRVAKECGCKFYLGSDAHTTKGLEVARERLERGIDLLDLQESDKFTF